MGWKDKISQALELPGKFLANGGHAQQDIPAQHRLLNAGGMFAGWWIMDQVRQAAFGVQMKSEGEYIDVPIDDVPAPLRFLHKTIDWNPHSEAPEHQWKKLAYQMLPGVGAGLGAVAGSMYAFERNGRAQDFSKLKGLEKLNLLDTDFVAQYTQSKTLRALTAFFGTFSAASGLTFLYGAFLNNAFMASNGARMFTGSLAGGNLAPHRAAEAQLGLLETYLKAGKGEAWANQFVHRVMEPMFGHELKTAESQAKAVATLKDMAQGYLTEIKASKLPDAQKTKQFANRLAEDLAKKLNLVPHHAKFGNANPIIHGFQETLNSIGLGSRISYGQQPKPANDFSLAWPLAGVTAAGVGAATLLGGSSAHAAAPPARLTPAAGNLNEQTISPAESNPLLAKHPEPDAAGKTPAEYVTDAMAMHNANYKGKPPGLLKWMGDAQLATLPTNRLYCAIGLTAGLMFAGNMAKIATGYGLDGKAVDASKVPTYLKWMQGIVKDYNPKGFRPRDRWIKYAQWGAYSLGGMMGIKWGTDYAYKGVKHKNSDPHYIEDYLPRVSMHQGDSWSWLASFAGIFGSASGLFNLPIPGLNYAVSLASRATSMQDRNFMIGGLNGMMSGATTTSFLRLREGVNYLCHYAVGCPEETPAQIEFLAYTMLGPIFKDKLTVDHIKRFTEAVHEVRDRYWQEGGIPKEKRKEALKAMREVFTGAGLEVLLIDLGLNPATIQFNKLNGLTGTIGNIGIEHRIQKEQDDYQQALLSRLDEYCSENLVTQAQADWVKAGIEAMKKGAKEPPPPMAAVPPESVEPPLEVPQKTFQERTKPRADHLKDLIKKSEEAGDWRTKAGLSQEHPAPAAIGG